MREAGFAPTHLDSHRHVHAHPALWPAVLRAAANRGVSNVRVPLEPFWANATDWKATLKKAGLLLCTGVARRKPNPNGSRFFFGISLQGGRAFASRLFALIPRLPTGTSELMTHPGHVDAAVADHDGYTWQREEELKALCSPGLRELLTRCHIELVGFGSSASRRVLRAT